eukprot:scaffold31318_cov28-Tisochrysis_lutea.AAC.3
MRGTAHKKGDRTGRTRLTNIIGRLVRVDTFAGWRHDVEHHLPPMFAQLLIAAGGQPFANRRIGKPLAQSVGTGARTERACPPAAAFTSPPCSVMVRRGALRAGRTPGGAKVPPISLAGAGSRRPVKTPCERYSEAEPLAGVFSGPSISSMASFVT